MATLQKRISTDQSHIDVAIGALHPNKKSFWHLNLMLDGAYLESLGFMPGKIITVIPEQNRLVLRVDAPPKNNELTW